MYLVDVLCLGLKITYFYFNQTARYYEEELKDLLFRAKRTSPATTCWRITSSTAPLRTPKTWAFRPDKDFAVTQYILAEDDESVELVELEFGRDGKPCFVAGPRDNVALVTGKLRAAVGEGNFTVMYPGGYLEDAGAFDEDDFEDEDEENADEAFDEYEEVDEAENKAEDNDADKSPLPGNG
jgi:hypothetical protein